MATGCQGPFVNGTGGWCGCDCKCCPPPDMVEAVLITYGPPPPVPMASREYTTEYENLELPGPPQDMPEFDMEPIMSKDRRFVFGGPGSTCSVPCTTFTVTLEPGGPTPVCGFQVNNGNIIAVGNGTVTVTPLTKDVPDCGTIKILVNGQTPPVFVNDGAGISVTLEYEDPWNSFCCACVEISEVPAMYLRAIHKGRLFRHAMVGNKYKIDPRTGLNIIVIDKAELKRRIETRRRQLRRKH